MAIPNEITLELDLDGVLEIKKSKYGKYKAGILGNELKFAYQWVKNDGNIIGYDAASGVKFGEYTFGDNLKEEAGIEAVTEFENDSILACCAVTYRDRSILCCVDLSLSRVMHSIKIMKHPVSCLHVIVNGTAKSEFSPNLHPILKNSNGLLAAGQVGGRIFLIDMRAKHSNWWKHNEVNPTSLAMVPAYQCDDKAVVQKLNKITSGREDHLAVVLDGNCDDSSVEVTSMEFCKEPLILIVGHSNGNIDIWSLSNLTRIFTGEPNGSPISHIMSMLPEDDPRKSVYVWAVENEVQENNLCVGSQIAAANLFVLAYKQVENSTFDYQEIDTVGRMFRLRFDSVDKNSGNVEFETRCLSVSPISIDITNNYMSTLNCTGLCSFVWCEKTEVDEPQYYSAVFDLGRWYAEEMPKNVSISDLFAKTCSYLAFSHLDVSSLENALLDAKVCSNATKKYIWPLNEEVTSYVAATSFSMMVLTSNKIMQIQFPGIQSYLFDKIDGLTLCQLMQPLGLFHECLNAGLMPEGVYDAKKNYPTMHLLEAIYEVAVNHNLLRFLRRCSSEFFDGKYESAGLSTQHLFEWAWKKALEVKSKSDALLGLLFSGQELTLSDKNSHNQYVIDLRNVTLLFQHVERENLLHTAEGLQGLHLRIRGLNLVNEYLKCVQYFSLSKLLPDTPDNGQKRLSVLKEEYTQRRDVDDTLMVDLLVERFGDDLESLWLSHGGDGKYPPPSMQSILAIQLLDTADPKDKYSLMLYFLLDVTKASSMNESLALGYKEMISSAECMRQVATSQFLWFIDHDKLQDALKSVETEKLDSSWIDTTYHHLYQKYSSKQLFELYRCIGFGTDTIDKKKFVIDLFVENGLIIPGFQWTRKNSVGGFEPTCFAFFLDRVYEANGLEKLVAKELNLKPKESMMLYDYLKMHRMDSMLKKLEEKIGSCNFVPCPDVSEGIFDEITDFQLPEKFERERINPIEAEEVQDLLKGSFVFVKQVECTPFQRHFLPQMSKPSILKASDSPAASPLNISTVVSPSPKRLRFQLPRTANVSTSSDDSSPVSEDLLHYEFEIPAASTPKSADGKSTVLSENEGEPQFQFAAPRKVTHPEKAESSNRQFQSIAFESPVFNTPLTKSKMFGILSNPEVIPETPVTKDSSSEEDEELSETIDTCPEEHSNVCHEESDEGMHSEDETNSEFASFVAEAGHQEQQPVTESDSEVASLVMEISEDEDERASTERRDMLSTSIVSSANESFFSTCDNMSPNASNISYSSALETTLTEETEDDSDPECPIIKKRQSHAFGDEPFFSADFVEVDDLTAEQISPTKFWHPPALESHPKPNEPSVSEIDLSNLPMPPSRPSPRKSVHWNSPNTSSRKILEEEESPTTVAHFSGESSLISGFEMSRDSERNDGEGSAVAAKLSESPRMERAKRRDPVFNDTINSTLERDMLEIEEEFRLKARESQEIDDDVDSEDDMTLDKTVILVSSGSGSDSPLKSFRISPRKPIKGERRTPDNLDNETKTASPSPAKVSPPLIDLDSPQETLQISPFKRFTRSETAKDEELKPVTLIPSLFNLNAGTSSNLGHASTSKEENLEILTDEAGDSSQDQTTELKHALPSVKIVENPVLVEFKSTEVTVDVHETVSVVCKATTSTVTAKIEETVTCTAVVESAESALGKTSPRKQLKTKIEEQITSFVQTTGKPQIPPASSSKSEPAARVPKKIIVKAEEIKKPETKRSTIGKHSAAAAAPKSKPPSSAALAEDASNKRPAPREKKVVQKVAEPVVQKAPARAASTSTKKSDALPEDVPLSKVKKTVAKRKMSESSSEAPARRPVGRPKNASKAPSVASESASEHEESRTTRQKPSSVKQVAVKPEKKSTRSKPAKSEKQTAKLTVENLKKFEKEMKVGKQPSSSQDSASTTTRTRRVQKSSATSAGPSREQTMSPESVPASRELRSRSRSVASEKVRAPRTSRRSSSVTSDNSVASQRSTRSKKRKAESDSDEESVESGVELRRSARKKQATGSKRAPGRRVSMIPEESD